MTHLLPHSALTCYFIPSICSSLDTTSDSRVCLSVCATSTAALNPQFVISQTVDVTHLTLLLTILTRGRRTCYFSLAHFGPCLYFSFAVCFSLTSPQQNINLFVIQRCKTLLLRMAACKLGTRRWRFSKVICHILSDVRFEMVIVIEKRAGWGSRHGD